MKVVVTGAQFRVIDDTAYEMLLNAGYEVFLNEGKVAMGAGTPAETVLSVVKDADAIIADLEPYGEDVISQCPNLKVIARRGVGYDAINLESCKKHGVRVMRARGAVEGPVAEHVMANILYFAREQHVQTAMLHNHIWKRIPQLGAMHQTLGILGLGAIGQEVAKRALPFGMKVIYYSRHRNEAAEAALGVEYRPLEQLLAESVFLVATLPLTPATRHMFNADTFAKMKPGSIFINVARGGIMVPEDLLAAVNSGHLRGAAVDVYDREPCTDSPLMTCDKILLTPHCGFRTEHTMRDLNIVAAQNIIDCLNGVPQEKMLVL